MISSHSRQLLVSHHSLAGASTSPAASSGTKPCCWPETPIATTRARRGIEIRETLPNRLKPPLGMLLAAAVGPFDQCQRLAANRKHAATIGVVGEQLGTLGADVEADDNAHAAARLRPSAASLLAGAAFLVESFKTPTLFRNPDTGQSPSCRSRRPLVAQPVAARQAAGSAPIALRLA